MSEAADERYARLAAGFTGLADVTQPERRGFARGGLMRAGKLFAVLRGEGLLLKLPADRVSQLIDMGHGDPFDANKGRPMREWVVAGGEADWDRLAREAYDFAG
jgi:hypothetical protein